MNTVSQLPFPVKKKFYLSDSLETASELGAGSPYLRNATINGIPQILPKAPPQKSEEDKQKIRKRNRLLFSRLAVGTCSVVDQTGNYDVAVEVKGNVIEYLEVEHPVKVGSRRAEQAHDLGYTACFFPEISRVFARTYGIPQKAQPVLTDEELRERAARSVKESARRRRSRLATLVNLNFAEASAFLTLTFAEHVTIEEAEQEAQKFCNRIPKKYADFVYVRIIELQQSGRPHYHALVKGVPADYFEKRWYVKTKKGHEPFQFLCENGTMGRDFAKVKLYESKTVAKEYARTHGYDVAYTSPAVKDWKQGFVEIHALMDRNGDPISDVGAYMLKYVTKEDALPKGVTMYSFSRGTLKQKGKRLLRQPAKQWFQWLRTNFPDFIKHERIYTGKHDILGQWSKVYVTLERGFARELELFIDDIFAEFQEDYEGLASFTVPDDSQVVRKKIGIAEMLRLGLL